MDPEDRLVMTGIQPSDSGDSLESFESIATIGTYFIEASADSLGRGNFGYVDLVRHRVKDVHLAMKVLDRQDLKRRRQLEHIESEVQVLRLAAKSPFLTSLFVLANSLLMSSQIYVV